MRKDKLYFLTFLSVTLIYILVAGIALQFLIRVSTLELLDTELASAKMQARTFADLVGAQFEGGLAKERVVENVQGSMGNVDQRLVFLSVMDWSGRLVAHPHIQQVGQKTEAGNSFVSSVAEDLSSSELYALLQKGREANAGPEAEEHASEVVFMYPIRQSDWIVASHINLKILRLRLEGLQNRFYLILSVVGLIIIPAFVITTRYIGSLYEKRLEQQRQKLEDEVISLSRLNTAVGDYQQKVSGKSSDSVIKKRILTQRRNELLSVPIEEIAHIYTENTVTYVVCYDGKRSHINGSLDELFSQLDETYFFRANRQFIIAISSIEKIVKYGNNQLKIVVNPAPNADILISKNKAAEFKNWLNL